MPIAIPRNPDAINLASCIVGCPAKEKYIWIGAAEDEPPIKSGNSGRSENVLIV
jgi:hypothetical protein